MRHGDKQGLITVYCVNVKEFDFILSAVFVFSELPYQLKNIAKFPKYPKQFRPSKI